ncbi:hypothetical protein D0Z00_001836 [Geotrichum galactomycetum]|uniref:Uncharacterized protein n=1 Tax=Geotrichum galactomycetum TaxID=27317 RepID=A0ACB6V5X1_9ASCO|nr:hypothetical protein D0Z00_001836 [Geotrichum candidum]
MVLPRPYANRKSQSRVSKQQYYQQAVAAQHTQAAAAAANYHHQQQQVQTVQSSRSSKHSSSTASGKPVNKHSLSLRESAVIRYIRHREWIEFVVGTAPLPALAKQTLPSSSSLDESIKQREEELAQLRAEINSNTASTEDPLNLSTKSKFYDEATAQLRASFPSALGSSSVTTPDTSATELKDKFGLVVTPSAPVVRLSSEQIGDLGLPVYKQSPPQAEIDARIAKHQAEVAATAAAAAPVVAAVTVPAAAAVPPPAPTPQDPTSLLATAVAAATGGAVTPTGAIPPVPAVDPAATAAAPASAVVNGTVASTEPAR